MRGMNDLMRQAQVMQNKLMKLKEEVGTKTVEGTSGGGMIKATVTGNLDLIGIAIEPSTVDPNDIDMLQDLVVAAVNDGIKKARDMMEQEMGAVTGGLKIPGMF